MVLLLAVVAGLGYRDLQNSSSGFEEYRRLARFSMAMSDVEAGLYEASYFVYQFLGSRNPENMKEAARALSEGKANIMTAEEFVKRPERKAILKKLENSTGEFAKDIDVVNAGIAKVKELVAGAVKDATVMSDAMLSITGQAQKLGNSDALAAISVAWSKMAATRAAVGMYVESLAPATGKLALDRLAELQDAIAAIRPLLHSEEGLRFHETLSTAFDKYRAGTVTLIGVGDEVMKATDSMAARLKAFFEMSGPLNAEVTAQMLEYGKNLLADNAAGQTRTATMGGVGVLLGVIFAAVIIIGIVRVLNNLSAFAGAIARGDFSHRLNVREKGEIGAMVEAMRQIPDVLSKVIQGARTLSDGIGSGRFRERLSLGEYSGSYADLAGAVNTVGDAYTMVMDELPVPVMCCDKDNKVTFLNTIGQANIGGNFTNTECGGARSDRCFGSQALQRKSPCNGEMTITPKGKSMEIAVAALPLLDKARNAVGYMEIITDLTEIKAKQRVMLQVAKDASDISDRVAAASEQLAAQVEQISRGAEMQRDRVHSTAGAMTEMNATVMEVARSAGQASEQSESTREKAREGADLVNQVVRAINTVHTVAAGLQDNMQELGKQAESIGGVMNVISDIADQTNLLALNAAIEAARAGEAGRGFAVVADEVRKLAEKTMHATQEVGANISSIQNSARQNIAEVGNAVKNINAANELADSSGSALGEIVNLAAANSAVVASIATAAEEQSATSEEINRAIEEINNIVGETTDGMVQSSAAVQELARMSQDLRRVMDGLK